jgi:hypothetical protein
MQALIEVDDFFSFPYLLNSLHKQYSLKGSTNIITTGDASDALPANMLAG